MGNPSLSRLAHLLVIIGGVVLVIFSLLDLLVSLTWLVDSATSIPFPSPLRTEPGFALLPLVLGIIAVATAKYSNSPIWAVVLVILGYIAGGIGGLLILIGGLVGLIAKIA